MYIQKKTYIDKDETDSMEKKQTNEKKTNYTLYKGVLRTNNAVRWVWPSS